MKKYLKLLSKILKEGEKKDDRTGTGTRSIFGTKLVFNLQKGFPLLTTKKIHLKSVIHELLWFLNGDTNIKYLNDNGVRIWNEWAKEDGELGPIYGNRWTAWGKPEKIIAPKPQIRKGIEATYLKVANSTGAANHPLGKTWEGMISRCYNKNDIGYHLYGDKGVHVANEWLEFQIFAKDAIELPKSKSNIEELVLDKDEIGNGFYYGKNTCQWITPSENAKQRYGFSLVSCNSKYKKINQIEQVIKEIKTNPTSRRLIVSTWDVSWIEYMALPPCHILFQLYCDRKKRLSLQVYQRSCDVFLGLPFNIASYAFLLYIIAQQTNTTPHKLIWLGGDTHIYNNHIEQVKLQLTRTPQNLPHLLLKRRSKYNQHKYEDFQISGYHPYQTIKAPISI